MINNGYVFLSSLFLPNKIMLLRWKIIVYSLIMYIRAEGTPDSMNPSVVDDDDVEGLPFPPLDELAFLTTQPTSLELSQVHFIFIVW